MRTHATAQLVGGRPRQCDRTAVVAAPGGVRAYALLDGVGSSVEVARWTRRAAHRTATLAARFQDAEEGLRAAYDHYATHPAPPDPEGHTPAAAAVVAVTAPGRRPTVAWCGDARAYLLQDGQVERLTDDHNLRRVNGGPANLLTSCLGSNATDADLRLAGHPTVESDTPHLAHPTARLVLMSDGAYEPLEQSCVRLEDVALTGRPHDAARALATLAVELGGIRPDNSTALVADLHRGDHY